MMSHNLNQFLPSLQLTLHEDAQTRLRHTATALSLVPGRTQVIIFGGTPKWEWAKRHQQKLAITAVLEFGEQTHMLNPGVSARSLCCIHTCIRILRCILSCGQLTDILEYKCTWHLHRHMGNMKVGVDVECHTSSVYTVK